MKTKAFSYQKIRARRDKLLHSAIAPYVHATIRGETPRDLCRDIMAALPANVSESAVFESVRILVGVELTRRHAADLAWRLAGNIDQLQAGVPVLPWSRQLVDEKIPVCVENMQPMRRKSAPGYLLYCRALAGSACPLLFTQFISARSCRGIAPLLGFSKPWGPYPYENPLHFTNLIFYAHVEAARSHTQPSFVKVSATAGMIKENRKKIEVRCRVVPCPRQFSHPCALCWVGYDNCAAAVHPKTYVARDCPECNTTGWFNPGEASLMCVQCRTKQEHLAE